MEVTARRPSRQTDVSVERLMALEQGEVGPSGPDDTCVLPPQIATDLRA